MKYDWMKMIKDQKESGLSIDSYCKKCGLCVSTFYKYKKKLNDNAHVKDEFREVEIINQAPINISMNIDGHSLEFDSSFLNEVIGALK